MCTISLDGEGNEVRGVGGLKERERRGTLPGAGSLGPLAKGDAMKQTRAPRRLETQPTGRPWRGQTLHPCPPLPGSSARFAGTGRRGHA